MMKSKLGLLAGNLLFFSTVASLPATSMAQPGWQQHPCAQLPSHSVLQAALIDAVFPLGPATTNGGFGLNMWATVINRDGEVCAVAFTGNDRGDQWPGSRVISAQKANTANAFSLPATRPASRRGDLTPVYSFNSQGVWVGNNPTPAANNPESRISRWRDVLTGDRHRVAANSRRAM